MIFYLSGMRIVALKGLSIWAVGLTITLSHRNK
jgi:hypothetical protein